MDKLKLTGQNWAEFSTLDEDVLVSPMKLLSSQKQPNLKLKTQPKQLLGYLLLAYALPRSNEFSKTFLNIFLY
jgi:hypothetical protein